MKRVLIANRSEIALDLISFFKKNSIETVLLCSGDDIDMLPARLADKVVFTQESSTIYFDYAKIIEIAIENKCDAIHPGYGFLANYPKLSEECAKKNITFIGPEFTMLEFARNRAACVEFVKELKLDTVETGNIIYNIEQVQEEAKTIGFPLLIIPNNGYFNYGIHFVRNKKELITKFEICQKETYSLLKNQEVLLEKFYKNAFSVEVPFARDSSGKIFIFPEMNTSTQSRFKKIVLETPAPFLNDKECKKLKEISYKIVESFNYIGVGSIEFIFFKGKFLFSNINPFIPIGYSMYKKTYGINFMKYQLDISLSKSINMEEYKNGKYGIEARIFAENWTDEFKPKPAEITEIVLGFDPVDTDTYFYTPLKPGDSLSSYYLPYLGKMITSSENRESMIENILFALSNTKFKGTINTINFLKNLIGSKYFREGKLGWEFIDHMLKDKVFKNYIEGSEIAAVVAAATIAEKYSDNELNIPKKRQSVWNKMGRYTILKNKKL